MSIRDMATDYEISLAEKFVKNLRHNKRLERFMRGENNDMVRVGSHICDKCKKEYRGIASDNGRGLCQRCRDIEHEEKKEMRKRFYEMDRDDKIDILIEYLFDHEENFEEFVKLRVK